MCVFPFVKLFVYIFSFTNIVFVKLICLLCFSQLHVYIIQPILINFLCAVCVIFIFVYVIVIANVILVPVSNFYLLKVFFYYNASLAKCTMLHAFNFNWYICYKSWLIEGQIFYANALENLNDVVGTLRLS
jgi:hypothetical protein